MNQTRRDLRFLYLPSYSMTALLLGFPFVSQGVRLGRSLSSASESFVSSSRHNLAHDEYPPVPSPLDIPYILSHPSSLVVLWDC
nr:hypothetical 9.3K protein - banana bunchy top virus [Banana bunchy top virus]